MPELPEVEVTKQGISPYVLNKKIASIVVRESQLRWLVPETITQAIGRQVYKISRRAKYLLLEFDIGCILIHLGMSGTLRIDKDNTQRRKHDHVELVLAETNTALVYNDPRKFGCVLWVDSLQLPQFRLFANLAPEPLSPEFNANYLHKKLLGRTKNIKSCLMDQAIVVGVGNIYANEVLFAVGINPYTKAADISYTNCAELVDAIKVILQRAIAAGGTTLKDFAQADGKLGYFVNQLNIYGRRDQDCITCQSRISESRISGRATYFCPSCQSL